MDRIPLVPFPEGDRNFLQRSPDEGGLGVRFHRVGDDRVEATWTVTDILEGWQGLLHGAGHMALHDDAAGWAMCALTGHTGFTTGVDLSFERPVPVGCEVKIVGRAGDVGEREGTFHTELILPDRDVASRAATTYAFVDDARLSEMLDADLSPAFSRWLEANPGERVAMVEERGLEGIAGGAESDPRSGGGTDGAPGPGS